MAPPASEPVEFRRPVINGSSNGSTSNNEEENCADVFGSNDIKVERSEDTSIVENGDTLLINPDLIKEVKCILFSFSTSANIKLIRINI